MVPPVEFNNPPIAEVAFGVTFKELPTFTAASVGDYWQTIKAEYPHTSDHPPLPEEVEQFVSVRDEFEVQLLPLPPLRRTWFKSSDERSLIQVQGSRFHFNEVRGPDKTYRRFEETMPRFVSAWRGFEKHVGVTAPLQYELVYSNVIREGGPFGGLADIGRVFAGFAWAPAPDALLRERENVFWKTSFAMPDKRGRLHIELKSGVDAQRKAALQLQLTARGFQKGELQPWFELAHEWIVRGFAEITTPEMHALWKRAT